MKFKPLTKKFLRYVSAVLHTVLFLMVMLIFNDIDRVYVNHLEIVDRQNQLIDQYERQLCPDQENCEFLKNREIEKVKIEIELAQDRLGRTYVSDDVTYLTLGLIFLILLSATNHELKKKYLGEGE
ncbi:MAG: hypothetical protein AAFQ94_11560 [Bacteroidota bacterium]